MIIKPRVRGFICVTAHPVGCEANVKEQIDYVTQHGVIEGGPKKVLVLGASTGYGLAARISAAFGCGAATLVPSGKVPYLTRTNVLELPAPADKEGDVLEVADSGVESAEP